MLKSIGNHVLGLYSTIKELQSAFYEFDFPADKSDFSADFKNILEAYKFYFSRQGRMSLSVNFYIFYTLHMLQVMVGKLRSVFFHFFLFRVSGIYSIQFYFHILIIISVE